MIVDCDRCEVRGAACGACVIGVLLEVPEDDRPIPYLPVDLPAGTVATTVAPVEFAEPERRALQVLAEGGLIPHLRLVEPGAPAPGRAGRTALPMPVVPPAGHGPRHRDVG
ncbi:MULTISPECIES: hypothetical protein [unclassified Pseudonocardia]|uniref:hypothetical protein n=1 Tax=unclassified Pseudonocardia TaxID=2619320 RepID=UPI001CF6E181|nr:MULTISPECIES: hypothetical protein [unclassified Pseudonocardia]